MKFFVIFFVIFFINVIYAKSSIEGSVELGYSQPYRTEHLNGNYLQGGMNLNTNFYIMFFYYFGIIARFGYSINGYDYQKMNEDYNNYFSRDFTVNGDDFYKHYELLGGFH